MNKQLTNTTLTNKEAYEEAIQDKGIALAPYKFTEYTFNEDFTEQDYTSVHCPHTNNCYDLYRCTTCQYQTDIQFIVTKEEPKTWITWKQIEESMTYFPDENQYEPDWDLVEKYNKQQSGYLTIESEGCYRYNFDESDETDIAPLYELTEEQFTAIEATYLQDLPF